MPFGLRGASRTFQRIMNVILSVVKWRFAIVYLDDILIFLNLLKEHFADVRKVSTLLNNTGVTVELRKCRFFTETTEYLGHIIRQRRFEIASRTTDAVRGLKTPKNLA